MIEGVYGREGSVIKNNEYRRLNAPDNVMSNGIV
jgi:hypothetical protein